MTHVEKVVEIRQRTGLGILEASKLLKEHENIDKVLEIAKELGIQVSENKKERTTGVKRIFSHIHAGRIGCMVQMACETDFAASTEEFTQLGHEVCLQIIGSDVASADELLESKYVRDEAIIFEDIIKSTVAKLGENIRIIQMCKMENI